MFDWSAAATAALGAVVGETARLMAANHRLAADMQRREEAGEDSLPGRKVRYPKFYIFSVVVYTAVAAIVAGFVGAGAPWIVHAYIGLSLPSFVGQILRVAEPMVPGRITPKRGEPDSATVDSTTVRFEPTSYRRMAPGEYRRATSLFFYLTA